MHTIPISFANPAKVLHTSLPKEEQAVRVLCYVLAFLAVAYLTLVSMSVINVIASQEAGGAMTALRTTVGSLESDYFALSHSITAEKGGSLGLAPVAKIHYVNRASTVGAADRARNDI